MSGSPPKSSPKANPSSPKSSPKADSSSPKSSPKADSSPPKSSPSAAPSSPKPIPKGSASSRRPSLKGSPSPPKSSPTAGPSSPQSSPKPGPSSRRSSLKGSPSSRRTSLGSPSSPQQDAEKKAIERKLYIEELYGAALRDLDLESSHKVTLLYPLLQPVTEPFAVCLDLALKGFNLIKDLQTAKALYMAQLENFAAALPTLSKEAHLSWVTGQKVSDVLQHLKKVPPQLNFINDFIKSERGRACYAAESHTYFLLRQANIMYARQPHFNMICVTEKVPREYYELFLDFVNFVPTFDNSDERRTVITVIQRLQEEIQTFSSILNAYEEKYGAKVPSFLPEAFLQSPKKPSKDAGNILSPMQSPKTPPRKAPEAQLVDLSTPPSPGPFRTPASGGLPKEVKEDILKLFPPSREQAIMDMHRKMTPERKEMLLEALGPEGYWKQIEEEYDLAEKKRLEAFKDVDLPGIAVSGKGATAKSPPPKITVDLHRAMSPEKREAMIRALGFAGYLEAIEEEERRIAKEMSRPILPPVPPEKITKLVKQFEDAKKATVQQDDLDFLKSLKIPTSPMTDPDNKFTEEAMKNLALILQNLYKLKETLSRDFCWQVLNRAPMPEMKLLQELESFNPVIAVERFLKHLTTPKEKHVEELFNSSNDLDRITMNAIMGLLAIQYRFCKYGGLQSITSIMQDLLETIEEGASQNPLFQPVDNSLKDSIIQLIHNGIDRWFCVTTMCDPDLAPSLKENQFVYYGHGEDSYQIRVQTANMLEVPQDSIQSINGWKVGPPKDVTQKNSGVLAVAAAISLCDGDFPPKFRNTDWDKSRKKLQSQLLQTYKLGNLF